MFPANVKTLEALLEEGDIPQLSLVKTLHWQGAEGLSSRCFPVRFPLGLVLPPLGGFDFQANTVLGAKRVPPVTVNSMF